MKYYKIYGELADGSLFSVFQPDCMSRTIEIGKRYEAKEVQTPIEDISEEDIQFYGVRTIEECIPFMIDGYVYSDCGYTEQDWIEMYTCPYTLNYTDLQITILRFVIVECEGTLKDDADQGEELTFYDQTVLRKIRDITNEELETRIKDVLTRQ